MHIVLFRSHSLSVQNNSIKEQLKQYGTHDWLGRSSQYAYNSFTSVMLPNILLIRKTFGWRDGAGTITKRRPARNMMKTFSLCCFWNQPTCKLWLHCLAWFQPHRRQRKCSYDLYIANGLLKYSVDILHEQLILFISNLLLQIQWTGDN